jgi:hypothetical protein
MNYFAHALPFLNRPNFMAGTGVPDWLMVADRQVRLRSKHVEAILGKMGTGHSQDGGFVGYEQVGLEPVPIFSEVAAGILQHLRDDAQFHRTRAFAETSLAMTVEARDALGRETGLRPFFLGHLLVEVLLDSALIADDPDRLSTYYRVLERVDGERIQAAVNRMAPRPTRRLARFIELFRRERVLWDYLEDAKLMVRLGQILRRVRLAALPDRFVAMLPAARALVERRKCELLEGIPA